MGKTLIILTIIISSGNLFFKSLDLNHEIFREKVDSYKTNFEFWISSLDKAADKRVTYHVTQDSIEIKAGPYDFIYFSKDYEKDEIVFKAQLDSINRIKLSELSEIIHSYKIKDQYANLCIIDGMILTFQLEWPDKKMSTTLSNYYFEKLNSLVGFVNRNSPKDYKIWYDKEELENDKRNCPAENILE
jgi:hypothetical protein